jgi:hypothetical protein
VIFDRAEAVRMSGMSEKAYIRSFNALQNGLGVKYASLQFCFGDRYVKLRHVTNKTNFAHVGRRWMCVSWASSLTASGSYLSCGRDCHCKSAISVGF